MDGAERKTLTEAQSLSERGYYVDAICILTGLTSKPQFSLEVTFELGETLVRQGYYNRALGALDRSLNSNLYDLQLDPFYQATSMLRCFVRAIVTAKIASSLKDAREVFGECTLDSGMGHAAVLTTTYYGAIIRFCHDTGVETRSVENDLFPEKLQAAFAKLMQDGEFSDALRIARTHDLWPNVAGSEPLLRSLASDKSSPPLIRAKAQLYLAEKLEGPNDHTEVDGLMDAAVEGFNSGQHCHGVLDISVIQRLRSADTMSDTFVTESMAAYDEMDCPSGLQVMLRRLLDLAYRLHVFDLQVEIITKLESLNQKTGARLIGLMTRVQALAVWARLMTHNAKVATGAAELYAELRDSECRFAEGQTAYVASMAFISLGDKNSAGLWAEKCKQAWRYCTKCDESTAATLGLNVRLQGHLDEEAVRGIIASAVQLVQQDIKENLEEQGAEKLSILLSGLLGAGPKIRTAFAEEIKSFLLQSEDILSRLSTADKRRAALCQDKAAFLLADSDTQEDTSAVEAALKLLNEAVEVYLKNGSLYEAANCRQMGGVCQISLMKKHLRRNDFIAMARDLDNAIELFTVAKNAFETIYNPSGTGTANYWIAWCLHEAWVRGWASGDTLLEQIAEAERNTNSQRSEISVLGGLSAITNKQALSSNKHTRHLYDFALEVCFQQQDGKTAWDWIQKGKARSLSDLLGLGVFVPEALRANITQHEESRMLFDEEKRLLEEIAKGSNQNRFPLRVELEKFREKMRGDPLLQELLDLREGTPIQLGSMQALLRGISSSRRTVCIDWANSGPRIYLFAVYADADPVFRLLTISLTEVQTWINEHLDSEEERSLALSENDEDNPFRELDPLVEPLIELSNPGDLLVLCPTRPLHSLPLHALWVNDHGASGPGTELVERNPFVYCANMTSFAQCCYRVRDSPPKEMIRKDFVSVYEPEGEGEDFDVNEQSEVYSSIASLASRVSARAAVGGQVTRAAFGEIIESSHMVHFHGHCDDSTATSITEQSLRLTAGPGNTHPSPFTVRDFFSHKLQAPLFILTACSSARQGISVGDEPLGLVTAALCAGASSVMGTLWPVESATARDFSDRFYRKLAGRAEATDCGFDLAIAVQETMGELKREFRTRRLYHWAPFVLHGTCFSRIPMVR